MVGSVFISPRGELTINRQRHNNQNIKYIEKASLSLALDEKEWKLNLPTAAVHVLYIGAQLSKRHSDTFT